MFDGHGLENNQWILFSNLTTFGFLYVGLMFIFLMFVVNEFNILAIANSNIVVVLFVFAVLQFSVAS